MAVALNEDVDRQYEWFKHVCAKNLRSLEDAEENAWEDTNLGSFQTSENEARYKPNTFCSQTRMTSFCFSFSHKIAKLDCGLEGKFSCSLLMKGESLCSSPLDDIIC